MAVQAKGKRIATLDVGTNTVLMLVAELTPDAEPIVIVERQRITRLGRNVDRNGTLEPKAATETLAAIVEFVNEARSLGAETIVGVATSALRDATDGERFLTAVENETGVRLTTITGETEAELSYLAVCRSLPALAQVHSLLIADIGGGSTELIKCQKGDLELRSLQIGSVRLTEQFISHDPPLETELEQIRAVVDRELAAVGWTFTPQKFVGVAGTVTTLAALAMGLESHDHNAVHGFELSRRELDKLVAQLSRLPLAERKCLPGMVEGRADVIVAGALILERIMRFANQDAVVVSDKGVRWGLLWREISRLESVAADKTV